MPADGWERVKELFQAALELPEPDRTAFLERSCGDDDDLRGEVASLLAAHDSSGDFLSRPPSTAAAEAVAAGDPERLTGQRIGPYRVLERIGRGGTGAVYLAVRDDDEFAQRVAIKLVRRGMATAEILQRFRSERQILASIDHPNIARLLDGGSTEEGLPYFVMEYIEGEPIDRWCDRRRLDLASRLELFRKVCAAVQVAHQNLVVHRDLKPGNILVTADGTPKLLDFGIAKLLNPELSRGGHDPTVLEMRVMTPDFASPEQIHGGAITTASDVYSLGILLFVLVSGHRPYRLGDRPMREMENLIDTVDIPRPSDVVGTATTVPAEGGTQEITPASVARARSTTPERLARRLKGDIDNIIGKALRREPQRRYVSVEHLADDLGRHARGLPVSARADTLGYRARKFVQRHRLPVAVGATAAFVAVAFAGLLVVQAGRVAAARDRAESEAAKTRAVNEFLQEILGAADPLEGMGAGVTVVDAVDATVPRIDRAFAGQPEVEAEVRLTIGETFLRLGRLEEAQEQLERSLRLRRALVSGDDAGIAAVINRLGEVRYDRGDVDAAEALYEESLQIRRRLFGEESAAVAESLDNLGNVHHDRGDLDEAERLYRQALETRERVVGRESPEVASSINNVAAVAHDRDELDRAESLYRESLAMTRRVLGEEHPDVATGLNNLAALLHDRGEAAEAEALYRESLAMTRRLLGDRHPSVAESLINLGFLLQEGERAGEAEVMLLEALDILRGVAGPPHPARVDVVEGLAILREDEGNWPVAERYWAEAVQLRSLVLDADDPELALTRIDHGLSLGHLGRWDEAEPQMRRAFDVLRADPEVPPHLVVAVAEEMAQMYRANGREDLAAEIAALAERRPER